MHRRIAFLAATLAAVAGLAVPAAQASRNMLVGVNDEANTLYGNPEFAFPVLKQLRSQALRVNLYWGGTKWAVAKSRPADPNDPGDRAYDWRIYDRLVRYASQYKIKIVFSILFTPAWANGGKGHRYPPTDYKDLENFAYTAAERYSGLWTPPPWQRDPSNASTSTVLPPVKHWTAWNEPNNPIWLLPQYKKVGKTWRIESAATYAKICNAIYNGVHSPLLGPLPGEQVACGVTGPRGNNAPGSRRASVDPMSFLTATKRFGLKKFDVWAHHPYYGQASEPPTFKPRGRTIQLGNIGTLLTQLSKLYGPKRLWITEYGYQTLPPDKLFGVSLVKQSQYLTQSFAIARKNPRIDMMLWFLIKDEPRLSGWQSGVMTAAGKKKPSFAAFAKLPR